MRLRELKQYLASDCRVWKEPRAFNAVSCVPLEPGFVRDSGYFLEIFISGVGRDKASFFARNALMVQAGTDDRTRHSVSSMPHETLALTAGPSQVDAPLPTLADTDCITPEPVFVPHNDSVGGPPPPPRVPRFYRYIVPFLGFVAVAVILVTVFLARTTSLSFVIVLPVILAIAIQWHLYKLRMRKLAEGVIAEAEYIKQFYPEAYPQYVDEARTALRDHGVGALAARLPAR